jgi:hypothetical protein
MTRTNPSKIKPRMDKTTDRKETDRKQILFTEGAKGGARRKLELDLFYLSLDYRRVWAGDVHADPRQNHDPCVRYHDEIPFRRT